MELNMKKIASLLAAVLLVPLFSCTLSTNPGQQTSGADNYFFPRDRTFHYKYSLNDSNTSDTVTYQVRDTAGGYLSLVDAGATNNTLYLFKQDIAADGSTICLLSNSATGNGFIALKGNLDVGSFWDANDAGNIIATVVGKYSEYYPPGRQLLYKDVIVVKYTDKNAASDQYVVRYFANGIGLVFERTISGPSDAADILLIARQGAGSGSNPDPTHDHWFNANGRYEAHMQDLDQK